jgi:hypothetical protein
MSSPPRQFAAGLKPGDPKIKEAALGRSSRELEGRIVQGTKKGVNADCPGIREFGHGPMPGSPHRLDPPQAMLDSQPPASDDRLAAEDLGIDCDEELTTTSPGDSPQSGRPALELNEEPNRPSFHWTASSLLWKVANRFREKEP